MKCVLRFLAIAMCIALAYSESCTVNTDCVTTQCATGSSVICEHPAGEGIEENGGLCTCAADICYVRDECLSPNYPQLECDDERRHCYDNQCICSRWPAIGR